MDDEIVRAEGLGVEEEDDDEKAEKLKLKPLSPERAQEVAREMQSLHGLTKTSKAPGIILGLVVVLVVIGIGYFIVRTVWDARLSVARHNYLFVQKRYEGLKKLKPGYVKTFADQDNSMLLHQAATDVESAMKILPWEVEPYYLRYNIYALELLVRAEERRVYGTRFSREQDDKIKKQMEDAWDDLNRVDPGLTRSRSFKDKYLDMTKDDLNRALVRIFDGEE